MGERGMEGGDESRNRNHCIHKVFSMSISCISAVVDWRIRHAQMPLRVLYYMNLLVYAFMSSPQYNNHGGKGNEKRSRSSISYIVLLFIKKY